MSNEGALKESKRERETERERDKLGLLGLL